MRAEDFTIEQYRRMLRSAETELNALNEWFFEAGFRTPVPALVIDFVNVTVTTLKSDMRRYREKIRGLTK